MGRVALKRSGHGPGGYAIDREAGRPEDRRAKQCTATVTHAAGAGGDIGRGPGGYRDRAYARIEDEKPVVYFNCSRHGRLQLEMRAAWEGAGSRVVRVGEAGRCHFDQEVVDVAAVRVIDFNADVGADVRNFRQGVRAGSERRQGSARANNNSRLDHTRSI